MAQGVHPMLPLRMLSMLLTQVVILVQKLLELMFAASRTLFRSADV